MGAAHLRRLVSGLKRAIKSKPLGFGVRLPLVLNSHPTELRIYFVAASQAANRSMNFWITDRLVDGPPRLRQLYPADNETGDWPETANALCEPGGTNHALGMEDRQARRNRRLHARNLSAAGGVHHRRHLDG